MKQPTKKTGLFRQIWHVVSDSFSTLGGILAETDRINIGLISAGIGFYTMLSIFPAMAALVAVWSLIADADQVIDQLRALQPILPDQVYSILYTQIYSLVSTSSNTLGLTTGVTVFLSLWTARAGVASLVRGVNTIYDGDPKSSLKRITQALVLTFSLMGMALIALTCITVVPVLLSYFPADSWAPVFLSLLRWIVALMLMVFALGLVYRYGPNREEHGPWFTPGAFLAIVLWMVVSFGFSYYLSNFANYNKVYGSIGAVAALLMWLYLSAYVVLLGAVLNTQLIRVRAQRDNKEQSEISDILDEQA